MPRSAVFLLALAGAAIARGQSYTFTTLAGRPATGSLDGVGANAQFYVPVAAAVDAAGNIYVAESAGAVIRKVTPAGVVTTLAGLPENTGTADGTGSAARFEIPFGIAVDSLGNVYVADRGANTIRKITPLGLVTTLAGSPGQAGNADGLGSAALFDGPSAVAVDAVGNIYLADSSNREIRKVTPAGQVTTLTTSSRVPEGIALDAGGNIYVAYFYADANDPAGLVKITPSGGVMPWGTNATYSNPSQLAVDSQGNLYVADSADDQIVRVTPDGVAASWAGAAGQAADVDGVGAAVRFYLPDGVAVDSSGTVYVADTGNDTIRRMGPDQTVTTLAGAASFANVAASSAGYADGLGGAARFNQPAAVAVDAVGNIYVADSKNNTIRRVTPGGLVTTIAGTAGVSGNMDGPAATALFNDPQSIAVDSAGNIYVNDFGNRTIRQITPQGLVSTHAGFANPVAVAVDQMGTVWIADPGNYAIRRINPDNSISIVAIVTGYSNLLGKGGPALVGPRSVTIGADGNVYTLVADELYQVTPQGAASAIAEVGYGYVDAVSASPGGAGDAEAAPAGGFFLVESNLITLLTGNVTRTIVGGNTSIGSADGPGATARFNSPSGIAVDGAGNLIVADTANETIRKGTPGATVGSGKLINASILSQVSGVNSLSVGFVLGSGAPGASETLLVRAIGPGLAAFGVSGPLPDPTLAVRSGPTVVASNQGWGTPSSNGDMVAAADSATVAFPLVDRSSRDAATVFGASTGTYAAQVGSSGGNAGEVLAEVYDVGPASAGPAPPRLANLSALAGIGSATNPLSVGFIIGGSTGETVLIRAIGPALKGFGVPGYSSDPSLALFSGQRLLATDSGWAGRADLAATGIAVGAFPVSDPASGDSMILATLAPGAYSAQVFSPSGTSGSVLLEVYEVPAPGN